MAGRGASCHELLVETLRGSRLEPRLEAAAILKMMTRGMT